MYVLTDVLLWLHFVGLAMGLGAGIALSVVGPRLVAAASQQHTLLWPLHKTFMHISSAGLALLLITGPLLLWLKFGGAELNGWFWAKMNFVGLAVVGVGLSHWASGRFHRGDKGMAGFMFLGGRLAGGTTLLAMLCAVFAFN